MLICEIARASLCSLERLFAFFSRFEIREFLQKDLERIKVFKFALLLVAISIPSIILWLYLTNLKDPWRLIRIRSFR